MASSAQVISLELDLAGGLLDLEAIFATDGKLGIANLTLGIEELTLTRPRNMAAL